jgi:hypothetical protein
LSLLAAFLGLSVVARGASAQDAPTAATFDPPFTLVGEWHGGDPYRFIEVVGQTAVVIGRDDLHVMDVSDPAAPTCIGHVDHRTNSVSGFAWLTETVVVVGWPDEFNVFDISDGSRPVGIAELAIGSSGENYRDVAVSGQFAHVGLQSGGFFSVDLSDPAHPQVVKWSSARYLEGIGGPAVAVSRDIAFFADFRRVTSVDMADPSTPFVLAEDTTLWNVDDLRVSGSRLYALANYSPLEYALTVFDIADPRHLRRRGYVDVPHYRAIEVEDTLAYAAGTQIGLGVFDVANPDFLVQVAHLELPGGVSGVDVVDDLMYLVNEHGLHILHVDRASLDAGPRFGRDLPGVLTIDSIYPDPFRDLTTASYRLSGPAYVLMNLYDLLGREVLRIVDGAQAIGRHAVTIDGSRLPPGVYVLWVLTGSRSQSRLLTVVR